MIFLSVSQIVVAFMQFHTRKENAQTNLNLCICEKGTIKSLLETICFTADKSLKTSEDKKWNGFIRVSKTLSVLYYNAITDSLKCIVSKPNVSKILFLTHIYFYYFIY